MIRVNDTSKEKARQGEAEAQCDTALRSWDLRVLAWSLDCFAVIVIDDGVAMLDWIDACCEARMSAS